MAVVGIYPVVGHFPALHTVILSPISGDVKQLLQQSNNLLINCPGFNFWGHWVLSDYNICSVSKKRLSSFFEVTGFASRRWAASSCQAGFVGLLPHTPPKGTFCKKSPWESRKTTFDFYCLVFHRLLPRYQKTGVHAAYSPSASRCACSAHREINPQNTAFGCKQLSGHILLPRYQKTGVHAAGF